MVAEETWYVERAGSHYGEYKWLVKSTVSGATVATCYLRQDAEGIVQAHESLTLRQLQADQISWRKRNFPDREAWEPLLGVGEEVGELNHAFLKRHQGIRRNEDHAAKIRDAVGDIIIFLSDFCTAEDIDMQDVLEKTWAEVRQRDWVAERQQAHEHRWSNVTTGLATMRTVCVDCGDDKHQEVV